MNKKITIGIVCFALAAALAGCASLERWGKDVHSDLAGGLNRVVNIYSYDGKKIASYEGRIDVEFNESGRVKFDLNGKRYIYSNAMVEIIEK
ncbi:DUF5052 family protein [Caproiciproducens sp. LBM24188]|jgi:hypothetical protein|nr:DUF5052 family protein [Oscillospiraceae bacterium]HHV31092.1 DUF5052 family protein [Clostridiales bacterium]